MLQAWQNVEALLLEMTPLLLEAKIPEHQVRMPVGDPNKIKTETYAKAFDWLHHLRLSPEWAEMINVKSLLPQHVWDGYKLHGFKGLQEQILLEKAHIKVRKAWKHNRPQFYGKVYKNVEETENGEQDAVAADTARSDV